MMARRDKLLRRVLSGHSDAQIPFDRLRRLLVAMGFLERVRGSHHVFVRDDVAELLTLQRDGAKAKPYQVRQVRALIVRYGLGPEG